jgi:hypothetical protein
LQVSKSITENGNKILITVEKLNKLERNFEISSISTLPIAYIPTYTLICYHKPSSELVCLRNINITTASNLLTTTISITQDDALTFINYEISLPNYMSLNDIKCALICSILGLDYIDDDQSINYNIDSRYSKITSKTSTSKNKKKKSEKNESNNPNMNNIKKNSENNQINFDNYTYETLNNIGIQKYFQKPNDIIDLTTQKEVIINRNLSKELKYSEKNYIELDETQEEGNLDWNINNSQSRESYYIDKNEIDNDEWLNNVSDSKDNDSYMNNNKLNSIPDNSYDLTSYNSNHNINKRKLNSTLKKENNQQIKSKQKVNKKTEYLNNNIKTTIRRDESHDNHIKNALNKTYSNNNNNMTPNNQSHAENIHVMNPELNMIRNKAMECDLYNLPIQRLKTTSSPCRQVADAHIQLSHANNNLNIENLNNNTPISSQTTYGNNSKTPYQINHNLPSSSSQHFSNQDGRYSQSFFKDSNQNQQEFQYNIPPQQFLNNQFQQAPSYNPYHQNTQPYNHLNIQDNYQNTQNHQNCQNNQHFNPMLIQNLQQPNYTYQQPNYTPYYQQQGQQQHHQSNNQPYNHPNFQYSYQQHQSNSNNYNKNELYNSPNPNTVNSPPTIIHKSINNNNFQGINQSISNHLLNDYNIKNDISNHQSSMVNSSDQVINPNNKMANSINTENSNIKDENLVVINKNETNNNSPNETYCNKSKDENIESENKLVWNSISKKLFMNNNSEFINEEHHNINIERDLQFEDFFDI